MRHYCTDHSTGELNTPNSAAADRPRDQLAGKVHNLPINFLVSSCHFGSSETKASLYYLVASLQLPVHWPTIGQAEGTLPVEIP